MEELIHGKEGEIATVNVRNGFKTILVFHLNHMRLWN